MRRAVVLAFLLAGCGNFPLVGSGINLPEGRPDLILPPEPGDPPIVFLTPGPSQPSQPSQPTSPSNPSQPSNPSAAPAMPAPGDATAAEWKILDLCNQQRAQNGAGALTLDGPISQIARFRSTDMGSRNYFAHVDPDGHDVFYYLKQAGISYRTAGENIGQSSGSPDATVTQIFNAWMNSAGHKANILNKAYGRIGIGAVQTGGKTYFTQVFAN